MRIPKLLASEDASKKKAHGDTSKQETSEKKEEEIGKERENKTARVKWGRGKREANNVMREIGIVMGTWYC